MLVFPDRPDLAMAPLVFWFVLLSVKHVLADFTWQPHWMAVAKDGRTGWLRPLLMHCAIHGACTTVLLLLFAPHLWVLGLVDFAIHLAVDRTKGYILAARGITQNDRPFWTFLGVDQTLHHLTGFLIAVTIAAKTAA